MKKQFLFLILAVFLFNYDANAKNIVVFTKKSLQEFEIINKSCIKNTFSELMKNINNTSLCGDRFPSVISGMAWVTCTDGETEYTSNTETTLNYTGTSGTGMAEVWIDFKDSIQGYYWISMPFLENLSYQPKARSIGVDRYGNPIYESSVKIEDKMSSGKLLNVLTGQYISRAASDVEKYQDCVINGLNKE